MAFKVLDNVFPRQTEGEIQPSHTVTRCISEKLGDWTWAASQLTLKHGTVLVQVSSIEIELPNNSDGFTLFVTHVTWDRNMTRPMVSRLAAAALPLFPALHVQLFLAPCQRCTPSLSARMAVPQFDVLDFLLGKDLQADTARKDAMSLPPC